MSETCPSYDVEDSSSILPTWSDQLSRPFRTQAILLHRNEHGSELREEVGPDNQRIPFYIHMERMWRELTGLLNPGEALKDKALLEALCAVTYFHDVDESQHAQGKNGDWRSTLDTVVTLPSYRDRVKQSLDIIARKYHGNLELMLQCIPRTDPCVDIMVNLVKLVDIADNSETVRAYTGEDRANKRIQKMQGYQRYMGRVSARLHANRYRTILRMDGIMSLARYTHHKLQQQERRYQSQLLRAQSAKFI